MTADRGTLVASRRRSGVEVHGRRVPIGGDRCRPDRWAELARFAKDTLGCRFFSFLTAVDWKEQGLEVVVKVDNLDDNVALLLLKTRLGPGSRPVRR